MPINAKRDNRHDLTRREFMQQTSLASLGALGSGVRLDAARGIVVAEVDAHGIAGSPEGRNLLPAASRSSCFAVI